MAGAKFNPLVSIVIPVYNGANYLKEAIDSAIAQTYKNIEILVINDGSKDNGATEKIAKSYGDKIRYFHKKNGGVATALNLGIKEMKGEYFSWLSHDDMYYPYKIDKQIEMLRGLDDKKVFIYADYALLKDGLIHPTILDHELLVRKSRYSLMRGAVNGITVLVSKNILDEVGEFSVDLKCTQDYDLWRRVQNKYEMIHLPQVISITRIHDMQDSVMSPVAVSEGNDLWIDMIKSFPVKDMIEYEKTEYNFIYNMNRFLKNTAYTDASKYCESRLKDIESSFRLNLGRYKVSVIVPFYNREKETIKAVKSVIDQTHKNIEILLVDDASTESYPKLESFVKNNKNIKIIKIIENKGPANARNIGIKEATGDYIAFLDSDDEYREGKIYYQLRGMIMRNPDFSHTAYTRRVDEEDVDIEEDWVDGLVVPRIAAGCPIATPTVMLRRKFVQDNNLMFNDTIRIGEDVCLWLDAAKISDILYIDKPLTIVNVGGSTHINDSSKFAIGLRNILTHELRDDYYSQQTKEIGILGNLLFNTHKDSDMVYHEGLSYGKYRVVEWGSKKYRLKKRIRESVPYRMARKYKREGIRGVGVALKKRIRRR